MDGDGRYLADGIKINTDRSVKADQNQQKQWPVRKRAAAT